MKTALYTFGVLALTSAGYVFFLCGTQWHYNFTRTEEKPTLSIVEKYEQAKHAMGHRDRQAISPLVQQAQNYAGYLNPPQIPKPRQNPALTTNPESNTPALRLPNITPKFRLLATCYNRTRPEESLALVSEPGRDSRWIEKGELLGHFVIESVERGSIVYRQGDRFHEMKVEMKDSIQIAQAQNAILELGQDETSSLEPSNAQNEQTITP